MRNKALQLWITILILNHSIQIVLCGWEEWGEWSACSRSCDGGATFRTRSCLPADNCPTPIDLTYATCNTQACADNGDFRAEQCIFYNDQPYKGNYFNWVPVYSYTRPCALLCAPEDNSFVAELAPKVKDGTRCRNTALDMCIDGQCKSVGCDHELDSGLVEDGCGICGGDGSSCNEQYALASNQPISSYSTPAGGEYSWRTSSSSICSVTCGVGQKAVNYKCTDIKSNITVDDTKCKLQKPNDKEQCIMPHCKLPVWISGRWQACSASCGGGNMKRHVYCVIKQPDGQFTKLDPDECTANKLITEKPCNQNPCPTWHAGEWTHCSVTCGVGVQKRIVICQNTEQYDCSKQKRPPSRRRCRTNRSCTGDKVLSTSDELRSRKSEIELYGGGRVSEGHSEVMSHKRREQIEQEVPTNQYLTGSTEGNTINKDEEKRENIHKTPKIVDKYDEPENTKRKLVLEERQPIVQLASAGSGEYVHPRLQLAEDPPDEYEQLREKERDLILEAKFVASDWSSCSTTCGAGSRMRQVECKLYQPHLQTMQILPDHHCRENKPAEEEYCFQVECPPHIISGGKQTEDTNGLLNLNKPETVVSKYEWQFTGYGPCDAQCLGGESTAEFQCVNIHNKVSVKDIYCSAVKKPDIKPESCNNQPCTPRWSKHAFGPCSAICGGGHQRRRVECVQDLSKPPKAQVRFLPDSECPYPIPPRLLLCNLIDCPPSWEMGKWSECSVSCGSGVEERAVYCQQVVAPGDMVNVTNESICPNDKPDATRPCSMPPCPVAEPKPQVVHNIIEDDSNYVQLKQKRKISLSVGGSATLIPGTNIIVRCPVNKYDKKFIHWKRKENEVSSKGRIKMSKTGSLQIRRSKPDDSDMYECMVMDDQHNLMATANISINFHSQSTGEELLKWRKDYIMKMMYENPHSDHDLYNNNAALNGYNPPKHVNNGDRLLMDTLMGTHTNSTPYMYIASDWTRCSKSCGGAGLQMRNITCEVVTENFYRVVEESLCQQEKPIETRDCGFEKCPVWMVGQWSQCSADSCFSPGVGTMVRPIYCILPNHTQTSHDHCDIEHPPYSHQPCPHQLCSAAWNVSDWSPCSVSCGAEGVRTRILKCVWRTNQLPAGIHCRGLPRPKTVVPCQAPSCKNMVCRDKSKYCNLVPMLKLCKYKAYKKECCYSCGIAKHKRLYA